MIDATTKVRGYAPGQTISVKINVFNDSREHVDNLEVKLIKVSLQIKVHFAERIYVFYDFLLVANHIFWQS